jgi:hypothetical protein
MSSDNTNEENFSVSIPVGAAVTALLLAGAAAAAYVLIGRADETADSGASSAARSGKSMFRRLGIMGLITLIENDATRKVVIAVLRAMAKRS